MDAEVVSSLSGRRRESWERLLRRCGLEPDETVEQTALLWDGEELVAAGSRRGCVLRCIAVDAARQGEGLLAQVLTPLRREAMQAGARRLFLYTKPANEPLFAPLLFYPVARTDTVVLMEDQRNGLRKFLRTLPVQPAEGEVGAAVMNCDPFTRGHRFLIERACAECERVYVFVLSEEEGRFSAAQRLEMVRRGTADLPQVTVLPTGPYLISQATFPTYFLKERDRAPRVQCELDIAVFTGHFVPHFGITRRYVGTEPLSPLTNAYNEALKAALPRHGVEVREIPRLLCGGRPCSAGAVRAALAAGDRETVRALLPDSSRRFVAELQREE